MNGFSPKVTKLIGSVQEHKILDNSNQTANRGDLLAFVNRQDRNINSLIE